MASGKLGMTASHRKAVIRNIVTSLLKHEKIETTEARAKVLVKEAEKMITLGKRGDLHARRQALAFLNEEDVVTKLFTQIAERYKDRQGGYTRIIKKGYRRGDAASMVIVELV
jgi:large subunit ribosomal protein L17